MNNHSTSECRNLSTAQNTVSQAKNRNRNDNSHQGNNQANIGNQQRPILSGNPLNQALANGLRTQRIFHNKHDVYYHPDAVANILSQSAEKDNGATINYDNDKDEYS
eukprot:gene56104-74913_t